MESTYWNQLSSCREEEEGYCKTCQRKGDGDEVNEYLRHVVFECPTVHNLRAQILIEFKMTEDDFLTNAGSVILDTLTLPNNSAEYLTIEFINTIWSITLSRILELNSKKKIPLINLIIGHIKSCLRERSSITSSSFEQF